MCLNIQLSIGNRNFGKSFGDKEDLIARRWVASSGIPAAVAATFAAAASVLLVAALAASDLPARRAAAVDPGEALRGQSPPETTAPAFPFRIGKRRFRKLA